MLDKFKLLSLKSKIDKHIKLCEEQNLYTLFNSKYAKELFKKNLTEDSAIYFYNLLMDWDNVLAVPKEVGEKIETLIDDKNFNVGIHRTDLGEPILKSQMAYDIFSNGIKNYGDLDSGAIHKIPQLTKTVSSVNNILNTMILLKSSYKNSSGGFLVAIPKGITSEDLMIQNQDFDKVYDVIEGVPYIKPEYIVAYVDTKYGVMNYISKESFFERIEQSPSMK